ncbi:tetratricopeptide repeat protein [Lyngbya confervoides]|uniref:Tetratricopeptide repeat protein n=1 Tax=Lyngbya confervoides BDU141951 TaxID=1574623 RepID=A0ABD4T4T7_9CYAN|nr:tetratricopeptide repeat protein [Lyngbya confervoides]MCM1983428.1 tetratricopeptide repeat protein [Lyngbya confervoides BDU141951]
MPHSRLHQWHIRQCSMPEVTPLKNSKGYKLFLLILLMLPGIGLLTGCQTVVSHLEAILRHDSPAQRDSKGRAAFAALDQGQYEQSIPLFLKALETESNPQTKSQLYSGLGSAYDELNQLSESMAAYEQALALTPDNPQIWVNLGIVQRLQGNHQQALQSYQQALKLDGNLATAHSSMGSLYVLQGQPKQAIAAFKKALSLDANLAVSHGNLALAYAMDGQFENANQSLKRAVALGYNNGPVIQARIEELQKLTN